jgi:methylated-DNA-[protein]-cysteine S-methyltransferase
VQSTPVGDLEVTVGPVGIERVKLPIAGPSRATPPDPRDSAFETIPGRGVTDAKSRVVEIVGKIDDYFAGGTDLVDVPIDLEGAELSDLQRHVLLTVRAEVRYGETATYGEVAELAGRPGAARAVGTAMSRNPVPLFVPCHRVVAANGIGGYGGGVEGVALKRALLARERRGRPTG